MYVIRRVLDQIAKPKAICENRACIQSYLIYLAIVFRCRSWCHEKASLYGLFPRSHSKGGPKRLLTVSTTVAQFVSIERQHVKFVLSLTSATHCSLNARIQVIVDKFSTHRQNVMEKLPVFFSLKKGQFSFAFSSLRDNINSHDLKSFTMTLKALFRPLSFFALVAMIAPSKSSYFSSPSCTVLDMMGKDITDLVRTVDPQDGLTVVTCPQEGDLCQGAWIVHCAKVSCAFPRSCSGVQILNFSNSVLCQGDQACIDSTIRAEAPNTSSSSTTSSSGGVRTQPQVSCIGTDACHTSIISTFGESLSSSLALPSSTLRVTCTGPGSCLDTTILANSVYCQNNDPTTYACSDTIHAKLMICRDPIPFCSEDPSVRHG